MNGRLGYLLAVVLAVGDIVRFPACRPGKR